jgi:hypothetical protein
MSEQKSPHQQEKQAVTVQHVWNTLQERLPQGSKEGLPMSSLERSWGRHILELKKAGYIAIGYNLQITIREEMRGKEYADASG